MMKIIDNALQKRKILSGAPPPDLRNFKLKFGNVNEHLFVWKDHPVQSLVTGTDQIRSETPRIDRYEPVSPSSWRRRDQIGINLLRVS